METTNGISDKDTAIFEQRPPLRSLRHDERLAHLAARTSGVLATVNPDGYPHLSTVIYAWDPDAHVVRVSTRANRAKAKNAARNHHASLFVEGPDQWSFVVAEGDLELSPISTEIGDATRTRTARHLPPGRRRGQSGVPRRTGRRAANRRPSPRHAHLRRHHRAHPTRLTLARAQLPTSNSWRVRRPMAVGDRRDQIDEVGDPIPVVAGGSERGAHDVYGERVASDDGKVLAEDAGGAPDVAMGLGDDLTVVTFPRRRRARRFHRGWIVGEREQVTRRDGERRVCLQGPSQRRVWTGAIHHAALRGPVPGRRGRVGGEGPPVVVAHGFDGPRRDRRFSRVRGVRSIRSRWGSSVDVAVTSSASVDPLNGG